VTEQQSGLRFDIYERVHLAEGVTGIRELDEIELVPHIEVHSQDEQAVLKGHLLLSGQYDGEEEAGRQTLEHWIPVEITLPMNRIHRVEDIAVEIENFDVDLLSSRSLNITGVLSLHGIQIPQPSAGTPWGEEEMVFVHESEADSEPEQAEWSLPQAGPDWEHRSEPGAIGSDAVSPPAKSVRTEAGAAGSARRERTEKAAAEPVNGDRAEDTAAEPVNADRAEDAAAEPVNADRAEDTAAEPVNADRAEETAAEPVNADRAEETAAEPVNADRAEETAAEPAGPGEEAAVNVHPAEAETAQAVQQTEEEVLEGSLEDMAVKPASETESKKEMKIAFGKKTEENEAGAAQQFKSMLSKLISREPSGTAGPEAAADEKPKTAGTESEAQRSPGDALEWKRLFLGSQSGEQFRKLRMCIVQKEETLESIADRYKLNPREIMLYNRLNDQQLTEGQVIYIPK